MSADNEKADFDSKSSERIEIPPASHIDFRELQNIHQLLWGSTIRSDVFQRWSQGFEFSDVEPAALIQKQGGPCAVIAPVEAFLLKAILTEEPTSKKLDEIDPVSAKKYLVSALCDILRLCHSTNYRLVYLKSSEIDANQNQSLTITTSTSSTSSSGLAAKPIASISDEIAATSPTTITASAQDNICNSKDFVDGIQIIQFAHIDATKRFFADNIKLLSENYGVLLFLYSVLLTKGYDNIVQELSDISEPLIDSTYGYGAQALINLMLTGRAVAHVWDNIQNVGGLELRGINKQSDIGFITIMEQFRLCTVGSFFKNPRYPVWVMGSDTHLSVLFSTEKRLVSPETPSEVARRIFKSFDAEGSNFIKASDLQEVLAQLGLVSDPAYVNIMQKKLDPEHLDIILLNPFMEEFFPQESCSVPDTFDIMHYNGIPGSNKDNQVRFHLGSAILLEDNLKSVCISNPMLTCLQTKWPSIDVNWKDGVPSLN